MTVGGVIYTFTVSTTGGETTVSIAISGPNAGGVTNLDALDLTFIPKNYYEDADIEFKYTVDVEAASGAKAHYEGSSTVVVDAVADISGTVSAGVDHGEKSYTEVVGADGKMHDSDGKPGHASESTGSAKLITTDETGGRAGDGIKDYHEKNGWETDTYKLDYTEVKYGFSVHVETTFPDVDGSEKHYVLVEKPVDAKWELGDLTGTGLKYTDGDTITIGGKTYWKLEVEDATKGDVKVDVPLQYNGSIAGDVSLTIKTGSYVEEQLQGDKHDPNAEHSGREYDMQNNTAVRNDGTEVSYKIDVLNSQLTVKTGWASEGANDAKHIGGAAGAGYHVTGGYAGSTGAASTAYDGSAPITLSLSGAVGSAETISSVTFTFDAARGTLMLGPGATGTLVNNGDGTWTLSGVNAASTTVYFKPATSGAASYDYSDVDMKYDVTVKNTAGSEYTFKGSSQVVIDAVADKPTAAPNGTADTQVDYPGHETPGQEQGAAKPGDVVTVHGKVSFPDTSGGENHFILIETGLKGDIYDVQSVTIKSGSGSLTLTGAELKAAVSAGTIQVVTVGGVDYYRVPVDKTTFPGTQSGAALDNFTVDITIKTEGETNHDNTVGFGGRSEVADVLEGTSGGAAGGSASDNYEFDKNNNVSNDTSSVKVHTEVVNTTTLTMSATKAYENADCNAHLGKGQSQSVYGGHVDGTHGDMGEGFVARAAMTYAAADGTTQFKPEYLADVQHDSSAISFSGTATNEAISALSVQFQCLKDANGDFITDTANFMYGDVLIPTDTSGLPGGMMTINGDTVYCSYDPATGMVTLTVIPGDGSYGDSQLYLVPGETFRSDDIPLNFSALVTDGSSGYTKQFGDADLTKDLCDLLDLKDGDIQKDPNTGKPAYGGATGDTVEIDAVAQQASLTVDASDVHSVYGDQYNSIVPGTTAKVHLDIDLRGDVVDGTESHFLYVKVPDSFAVDKFTVTYLGVDGQMHTVTVNGGEMGLQAVNSSTGATGGTYFSWNFGNLSPAPANGDMDVDLYVKTPGGASGKAELEVGVRSQEEWYKITSGGDHEDELTNNQANTWDTVEIPFSSCTKATIGVGGYFYENSNMDAHLSPEGQAWAGMGAKDGHENWAVPLNISFGDSNDAVENFSLALQDGSKDLGDLYLFTDETAYNDYLTAVAGGTDPYAALQAMVVAGRAVNFGDSISLNDIKDYIGKNAAGQLTGELKGKIIFMPDAESYSGKDPKLDYTVDLRDVDSGQPTHLGSDTDGALSITADSVAQRPSDLHFDADSGAATGGELHEGQTRTVTVSASFADVDGSTSHYILIEALGGWTLTVGGKTYGPEQMVTLNEGGKTYYKIDVTDQVNTAANQASGTNHGSASVTVELTAPTGRMFLGEYDMEVKAGSTDKSEGGEITFHNNTAVIENDGLSGEVTRDTGPGTWYFEQTASLYEDNKPNQHLPGTDAGGNPTVSDQTTEASGHFDVAGPDGGKIVITVETINGEPVLDITGPGVTYDSATGTYTIDMTAYNAAGGGGIDMKLSDAYLQNGGANCDADQLLKLKVASSNLVSRSKKIKPLQ